MRRPGPLPSAPEQEPELPARARRRGRREAKDAGRVEEETTAAAPSSAASLEAEEVPDGDAPVSVRDVWKASRARRKALRQEIRRFTQRSRRRRWIWLSAIAAVIVVIGGSVAVVYSPLFAVQKITVVGATSIGPEAIEDALGAQIGVPLAAVDSAAVKEALIAFPLIESYSLEAKPPHELTVRIVERTPVGVIASDAGYSLVDAAGVVLATTPEAPAGQPLIEVSAEGESSAFSAAGLVIRSLPDEVRATVVKVAASTGDDVTLTLASGVQVLWGSADDSALKAVTLSRLLAANPEAKSYDISSPGVPVAG